jgi:putative ABC transport system permease protein
MALESVRQAIRLLWAHKLRSVLTMFGIVWGTASVIFLVGWGEGSKAMMELGFFKAGKNMGEVWAGKVSEEFTPAADRRFLWFTLGDVKALRERARVPEVIGAERWEMLPAVNGARAITVDVRGVDTQAIEVRGIGVGAGRHLSRSDIEHRRRVVVVGDKIRARLLGPDGRVGSWIRLAGKPFRVIGFLEPVGTQLSRDRMEIDEQVWIPITTHQANWPSWWTDEFVVTKIIYRMPDRRLMGESEREVRAILAGQIGVGAEDEEAVGVWSSLKLLNQLPLDQTTGLLFILASATLLIGGIGVLNMMLDAVHERRQEIGVRLAIGARRRDVVLQFFVETLTICVIGGVVGALLGIGACLWLGSLDFPDLVPVPTLRPGIVGTALGVLVGVGVTAGVIPAWRAARVDPAVMLREE